MAEIDYSYRKGLIVNDEQQASPEELRQPLFPDNESYHNFIEAPNITTGQITARLGVKERKVGYTFISPQPSSNEVVIHHQQWGEHCEGEVGKRQMAALNSAIGQRALLLIDSPGSGRSDSLSSLAKEASRTGSFLSYGEFYTEALQTVTEDFDTVVYSGPSLGGRMAIAEAAYSSRDNQVVAIDPPGSRQMTTLGLMRRFAMTEAGHGGKYKQGALEYDPQSAEAQIQLDTPLGFIHKLGDAARRGALLDLLWREPHAMARQGLASDLEAALANEHTRKITIMTPDHSHLTDSSQLPTQERVEPLIIHGHTHALFSGHPGVLGQVLQIGLAA